MDFDSVQLVAEDISAEKATATVPAADETTTGFQRTNEDGKEVWKGVNGEGDEEERVEMFGSHLLYGGGDSNLGRTGALH